MLLKFMECTQALNEVDKEIVSMSLRWDPIEGEDQSAVAEKRLKNITMPNVGE